MTVVQRLSDQIEVRPAGDRAVLLIPDDPAQVLGLAEALRASPLAGVVDILPAAETVLLFLEPGVVVSDWKIGPISSTQSQVAQAPLVVPVRYDGPDLAEAATAASLSQEALIARHTAVTWRCGFVGFAPGFAYLESAEWTLPIPRRSTPRTDVPAGSVALAAKYSAIYPTSTPGGWQLIGSTDIPMFDVNRDPPALITPGRTVRFVAIR